MKGRLHTRYAPVRRSQIPKNSTPRLACVKPAASVHPEPGSNSSSYILILYNRCLYLSVLFESCDSTALISFVLMSPLKRLSIQYVYERVFYSVSLVFQSGCKTKTSFCFSQEKLEKILKLFFRLFFSNPPANLPMNFPCFAGCKCKKLFQFPQAFSNLFFWKFLSFRFFFLVGISKSVSLLRVQK